MKNFYFFLLFLFSFHCLHINTYNFLQHGLCDDFPTSTYKLLTTNNNNNVYNNSSPLMSAMCVKLMTFPWMWLFMKNPYEGAQCAIRLATDPQLKYVTGEYFNDCDIAATSELGQDKELAKKLYMQTVQALEKVTKLQVDKKLLEEEEEEEEHNTDIQDDEVEALQMNAAIKNKLE